MSKERELRLTIKVKPFGAAAAADAKKLTDQLDKTDKAEKKLTATTKQFTGVLAAGLHSMTVLGRTTVGVFDSVGRAAIASYGGIGHAARGAAGMVDGLNKKIGKLASLRNLIVGNAIVGRGIEFGRYAFGEGGNQLKSERLAKREFGDDVGYQLLKKGDAIGKRAGVQGDEAARGLFEIRRSIEADEGLQVGKMFHGKKLTAQSLASVKDKLTDFGGKLYERALVMNPELDKTELGRMIAQAGTGKEGVKSLGSALGMNKAVIARIEREGEKNHLGRGDILMKMFDANNMSERVVEDEKKTRGFKIRALKAEVADRVGEEAANAMRGGSGGGAIDWLRNKIPGGIDFAKNHFGTIGGGLATYAGLSIIGSKLGGASDGGALPGGKGGPAHVIVDNAKDIGGGGSTAGTVAGVVAANKLGLLGKLGLAGAVGGVAYAGASYLEKKAGLTTKAMEYTDTGAAANAAGNINEGLIKAAANRRKARIAELEASGIAHGKAIYQADQEGAGKVAQKDFISSTTVNLVVDGKTLASVVNKANEKTVKNATANGAAK